MQSRLGGKMKRVNVFVPLMLILIMAAPSPAGKTKTAIHKNDLLTDQRYPYSMKVLENWKTKTFKEKAEEPELFRAMVQQKNYRINQEAKDFDADFTIPEIQIYIRPDTISASAFMEQLKNDVKWHRSEDDIINKLNLILSGEYVGMQETELGGVPAVQAIFKRKWKRELQTDPEDPRYRQYGGLIVRDVHDVHEVYIISLNGTLYAIQAVAENEFYSMIREEFHEMVASINFEKVQPAKKSK
jgi:hypothetical protein